MLAKLATVRKALVAVVGVIAQVLALGVLTGTSRDIAVGIVAVATVLGVYHVENATADPAAQG